MEFETTLKGIEKTVFNWVIIKPITIAFHEKGDLRWDRNGEHTKEAKEYIGEAIREAKRIREKYRRT